MPFAMGIAKGLTRLLLEEKKKRPFCGALLQLGRQDVFIDYAELEACAALHDVKLAAGEKTEVVNRWNGRTVIDDKTFFSALGFSEVESCDYSEAEQPTFTCDLNLPVAGRRHGKYDVVIDSGTSEHIFNLPGVFANIHRFLKIGGRVIHVSPSHNHVDHGFYMFSPTLFSDYYAANGYTIETSYIFAYSVANPAQPWGIFQYSPGCLDAFSMGGFDASMIGIFFVARKEKDSTGDRFPAQGCYRRRWPETKGAEVVQAQTGACNLVAQY